MLNSEFHRFILNRAVQSKLSSSLIVDRIGQNTIVFVEGYPFTLKGFYILMTKTIFGGSVKIPVKTWKELHAETRLLCEGLELNLASGREAFSVIKGLRKSIGWSSPKDVMENRTKVIAWLNEVSDILNHAEEYQSLRSTTSTIDPGEDS